MADHCWTWRSERVIASDAPAARAALDELLAQLNSENWSQHDVFGVHLAMEEALMNAIKHGNKRDINKSVRVSCRVSPDKVRIEIADQGPGFDPSAVPDPTLEENLDVPSGRGIMLMQTFMSHVEYSGTGNCVIMEKARTAAP